MMSKTRVNSTHSSDSRPCSIRLDDVVSYMHRFEYGENCDGTDNKINCWGLVRYIQKQHFGLELPWSLVGEEMGVLFGDCVRTGRWQLENAPFHGAGVLMRGGIEPHCGIWLDLPEKSGVLHCERGTGIKFQDARELALFGYPRLAYYRFLSS